MKKITLKQYTVSLYETIKDLSGEELNQKVRNFLAMIQKRKSLKLLNKIYKSFIEIYEEREGILKVKVTSARGLSNKVRTEIIHWLQEETNQQASVEEEIDPKILGGVIIKFKDTILDGSLKNQLKRLQNSLGK